MIKYEFTLYITSARARPPERPADRVIGLRRCQLFEAAQPLLARLRLVNQPRPALHILVPEHAVQLVREVVRCRAALAPALAPAAATGFLQQLREGRAVERRRCRQPDRVSDHRALDVVVNVGIVGMSYSQAGRA